MTITENVKRIITLALDEDIAGGDVTSDAIFTGAEMSEAYIMAKDSGIWCGSDLLRAVYAQVDSKVVITIHKEDGAEVARGDIIAELKGATRSILVGERTALNFLQRMCGVATKSHELANLLRGSSTVILDTRKTAPGMRALDKYAVKAGGCENHRSDLHDMVLIKDNHIRSAGSVTEACARIRKKWGHQYRIEVETSNMDEVKEAIEAGCDIIMLDNMSRPQMEEAIAFIAGRCKVEISGNMNNEKILALADIRADYISVGALTHSVKAFDLSMKFRY